MGRHVQSLAPFLVATLATLLAGGAACTKGPELTEEQKRIAKTIKPAYDETTGRLKTLTADRDGDGKTDSWLHMDGAKLVSAEYDTDQDGVLDRWEWTSDGKTASKIGLSTKNDGTCDRWEYPAEGGGLVRAEEDMNRDGVPDKWETFADGVLRTVEFDTDGAKGPDVRWTYDKGGTVILVETEPDGAGGYRRRKSSGK